MDNEPKKYTLDDILPKYNLADIIGKDAVLELTDGVKNTAILNEGLARVSALISRELTDDEAEAVLDIVDVYTPTDENDMYITSLFPFERAWEIYQSRCLK